MIAPHDKLVADPRIAGELERITAVIRPHRRVLVAFSGGVDSALVAAVAHRAPEIEALAITGCSPSLAAGDRRAAAALAADIGIRHREIDTHEMESAGYRANAGDRCYFCKGELYTLLEALRRREGFDAVLDGTNADDLGGHRPGLAAAREQGVVSPLVVAGLDKARVRAAARALEIPVWDRPANACLASRLPVGTLVSADRLLRVERAEAAVRAFGFEQLRVRDMGDCGRLEVGAEELGRALDSALKAELEAAIVEAGFERGEVDVAGYRPGGADRRSGG